MTNKQTELYDDPNRYAEPGKIDLGDVITFHGYQKYFLSDSFMEINPDDKGLVNKKLLTNSIFYSDWIKDKSVLDLGANSAYFCFHSLFKGAAKTRAVEMDNTYVNMLTAAKNHLNIQNFEIENKNVSDISESADLVFAFALIHWIYSCTADYGSLDQAIKKLSSLTNKLLVIEWIEPNDEAIKFFKHTEWNKEVISEEYSKENFEKALSNHFDSWEVVGNIKDTRKLYFAFKEDNVKNEIEKSYIGLPLQDIFIELNEKNLPYVILRNEEIILNSYDKFNDLTIDVLISNEGKAYLDTILDKINLKNSNGFLVYQFEIGEYQNQKLYINLRIISENDNLFNKKLINKILNNRIKQDALYILNNNDKILYLIYSIVYFLGAGDNTYTKVIKELSSSSDLNLIKKQLNNISYLESLINEHNYTKNDENKDLVNYSFRYINPIQTVLQSRILCWYEGTFYISRIYKYLENEKIIIQKQANKNIAKNEYDILSTLDSEYFPNVFDYKEDINFSSFKMKFIEGKTLGELKSLKNLLNNQEIKEFINHCFSILLELKSKNILHRDISPSNIILKNKKPVLIDFGWAESDTIKSINAPGLGGNYKKSKNEFSDLYSIGRTLSECLNGIEEFESLINKMINLKTKDDFETINELINDLNQIKITNPLIKAINLIEEGKKLLEGNYVDDAYKLFISAKSNVTNAEAAEIGIFYLLAYCEFNLSEFEKASENITTEMILNPDNLAAFELDEKINIQMQEIEKSQTKNVIENEWDYDVSIVIPVYNRHGITEQCIRSIYENTYILFELIVVDNGSDADTKKVLEDLQSEYKFRLIRNENNLGFSVANNQAIENRKGKHVFLLNNDTVVTENWLDSSLKILNDNKASIVGSCLLYPDSEIIQHKGVVIGTEDGNTLAPYHIEQYHNINDVINKSKQMSAVTGAAMLISEDLIAAIGGLDEGYINGLEDIDYCFKASSIGAIIWYNADSIIYHYESLTKDRHKHDIPNWQRLNKKWLGKINFDEKQEQTNYNVSQNKEKQRLLNEEIIKESKELNNNLAKSDIKSELTNPYEHVDFSIIIPVHNNLSFTKKCIENIYKTSALYAIEVIIIDNGSEDETFAYLNSISDLVKVIKNENNESFSKANNQGAAIARGKYLVFLNNDVEVQPGWLESLEDKFKSDSSVGIQGAKLVYPNGLIQHAGVVWGPVAENFNLHYHIYLAANPSLEWVNKYREFQMVTGALLAIRKELFSEVGKFDEEYFFGHEDLDLCLKVRKDGYKVMYNPEVVGIHHESITKKSEGIKKFERFITEPDSYDAKNHKHFLSKWEKTLKVDANEFYLDDKLYGIAGDVTKFELFQEKLKELFEALKPLPEELYQRKAKKVSEILFANPSYDFVANVNVLLNTSYDKLLEAIEFVKYGEFEDNSKKKLKILMTMFAWNESGGGTIFPRDVAVDYVKQGYEVLVVYAGVDDVGNPTPYHIKQWNDEGVNLLGIYNREINFIDPYKAEFEINDPSVSAIFEKVLNEFKPDLVHFHNFVGLSFNIAKIAKTKGYKTLYTPFNYHLIDPNLYMISSELKKWENVDLITNSEALKEDPSLRESYLNRIEAGRQVLNQYIDMTLAVSTRVKDILIDFGCRPEKITIVNQVPKSVEKLTNTNKNRDISQPIKIGYIGGVMPHKGVHNLVVAASVLQKDTAELNIYGFVDDKYKAVLENINTNINVNLKGEYKFEELNSISENIDIAVLPSLWEDNAPFAILESLAMGLPVIAPNIGGFSDFIENNFNGRIYQYDNVEELANILRELTNSPELITKMRENAYLTFSFSDYINQMKQIYLRTIENTLLPMDIQFLFKDKLDIKQIELVNDNTQVSSELYSQDVNSPMNRLSFDNNIAGGFSNKSAVGQMPDPLPSPLLLNLGCGNDIRQGFVNIDLFSERADVVKMDIRKLNIPDNSVDVILASDVLEHFSHRETQSLLKEWNRVLKDGAEIIIRCPNIRLQIEAYMRGDWDADVASYMIFGGQTNPGDYHCIGFDKESITKHLTNSGFDITSYEEHDFPQNQGFINLNMTVKAKKKSNNVFKLKTDENILKSNSDVQVNAIQRESKVYEHSNNQLNPLKAKLNIIWEGTQFVYHSLALINREVSFNMIKSGLVNLTIIPYEDDNFSPEGNTKFEILSNHHIDNKVEEEDYSDLPYVWIRHQWPPQDDIPEGAKWIIMQPWEYTALRQDVYDVLKKAEEVWTPSNFSRQSMINSGLEFDKVQVMPNGINPEIFNPYGPIYKINSNSKIKFLFVGGTLPRKGIDVLLKAFVKTYTKHDPVSLVIKDIGGDTFYQGQNAQEQISTLLQNPDAPEIIYITEDISEEEMASLYRACDVFVSSYRGEGFCLPALEAMACGLPVIVTDGGATDDFVDEFVGWKIESKPKLIKLNEEKTFVKDTYFLEPDEESLIKIFEDIINNPNYIKHLGYVANYKARKFWTWEKATLKMYTRLDYLYNTNLSKDYANQIKDVDDDFTKIGEAEYLINIGDAESAIPILDSISDPELINYVKLIKAMLFTQEGNYDEVNNLVADLDYEKFKFDIDYLKILKLLSEENLVEAIELLNPLVTDWQTHKWETNYVISLDFLINMVGDIVYMMEDYVYAEKIYDSGIELAPSNISLSLGKAKCKFNLGSSEDALSILNKLKDDYPDFEEIDNLISEMEEYQ